MNRYKLYTGPTQAQHVANVLLLAGYDEVFQGTENVYFNSGLSRDGAYMQLRLDGVTGYRYTDLREARNY
jgi:hypothetical protein